MNLREAFELGAATFQQGKENPYNGIPPSFWMAAEEGWIHSETGDDNHDLLDG
jgi:hypothetical protein